MKLSKRAAVALFIGCCGLSSASSLGQHEKQPLEKEVRRLYDERPNNREQAASKLIAAGPVAIPLLLPVLCDESKPHFDRAWPAAAKALGALKAEAASRCLVRLLLREYPSVGIYKPDETLSRLDPAFGPLLQIGDAAVPTIRRYLPTLDPNAAYMALRVLRAIDTPSAKEAAEAYIEVLERQIQLAKQVLQDFTQNPGAAATHQTPPHHVLQDSSRLSEL